MLGEGVLLRQLLAGIGSEAAIPKVTALAHVLLAGLPRVLQTVTSLTQQQRDKETGRYLSGLAFGLPWLPQLWR